MGGIWGGRDLGWEDQAGTPTLTSLLGQSFSQNLVVPPVKLESRSLLRVTLQIILGDLGSIWQLAGTQYIFKRLSCAQGHTAGWGTDWGTGHCLLLSVGSGAQSTGLTWQCPGA